MKPSPKGTLVTGWRNDPRMPVSAEHEDHLWCTGKPRRWDFGMGWRQRATCVVDGYRTLPLDAAWWLERAKPKDVRRLIKEIRRTRKELKEAITTLRREV